MLMKWNIDEILFRRPLYLATFPLGKNGFAEVSKNLVKYKSESNFVWTIKIMWNEFKGSQKCLSILHNYFNEPIKLFSDLYAAKFLDTSTKPFFPYIFSQLCVSIKYIHI